MEGFAKNGLMEKRQKTLYFQRTFSKKSIHLNLFSSPDGICLTEWHENDFKAYHNFFYVAFSYKMLVTNHGNYVKF
jgi:hypothetical protein